MLLQAGQLEVGIDRLVGLDQVALGLQPLQRVAQADRPLDDLQIFPCGLPFAWLAFPVIEACAVCVRNGVVRGSIQSGRRTRLVNAGQVNSIERAYSICAPDCFTTAVHFGISDLM